MVYEIILNIQASALMVLACILLNNRWGREDRWIEKIDEIEKIDGVEKIDGIEKIGGLLLV